MTLALARSQLEQNGISVSRVDGWVILDRPEPRPEDLGSLLDRNADLAGPERFCLDGDGTVHLRIDLPTSSWDDVESELGDGTDRIEAATEMILAAEMTVRTKERPALETIPDKIAMIPELSRRGCTQHSPQRWTFTLDTGAYLCMAELTAGGGLLHVNVPFQTASSVSPEAHQALSTALLLTGGAYRTVRPVRTRSSQGPAIYGIGGRLSLERSEAELPGALQALHLAAHAIVREVQVLQDPNLAALYLNLQGRSTTGFCQVNSPNLRR